MTTEAEAVADLVRRNAGPDVFETPTEWGARTRHDEKWVIIDKDPNRERPLRASGTVVVHDAASFMAAVIQRRLHLDEPVIYANHDDLCLVAVLNDDRGDNPGWRDYRVLLDLRPSPEWERWTGHEGLHDQATFASFVEDSVEDFIDPSQSDMLALAQTFQASTSGRFKSGSNLHSGARQLVIEEEVEAKAGHDGTVTIPRQMRLALRPFFGSVSADESGAWVPSKFTVTALFKFDIRDGKLKIGYRLVQPDEVRRAAFTAVVSMVTDGLGVSALSAPAPAAAKRPPETWTAG